MLFEDLQFRYPFRRYQALMLSDIETKGSDQKLHLVAPPGSGKTIVGLELIRRLEQPAVVFTPTTTIQHQWQDRIGMFTEPQNVADVSTLDPEVDKPISIFTYQLISVPSEANDNLRGMAERAWAADLIAAQVVPDSTAAEGRIQTLKANNPDQYRKEIARKTTALRRVALKEGGAEIGNFIHPNARALVDRLVARGVRTIVLDECHHLLDYWAVVLRYLIDRLESPTVIGLTATLPSLDDGNEYENYTSLLGDVDFEVPTPAVVKEGDLAPYRDLAYFTVPTSEEQRFLANIEGELQKAISEFTTSERFTAWIDASIPKQDRALEQWDEFFAEGLLAIALLRFATTHSIPTPDDFPIPIEAQQAPTFDDWLLLIPAFGLHVLKPSDDPADHEALKRLRSALSGFGLTLTERGLRSSRSPGDLVLAFSNSKDLAAVNVLKAESSAMGDKLRALVLTDFEQVSSGVSRVEGVLGREAGSARRAFATLLGDPVAAKLKPILVTGKVVLAGAEYGETIAEAANDILKAEGLPACTVGTTDNPDVVELVNWSSRVYVPTLTQVFSRGITQVLVGTRGLFGEGWDCVRLNTLIDLTAVTTATGVQQIRGRSFRLDPEWPEKCAHNWDIVCVEPSAKQTSSDLNRFVRKHDKFWGLVTAPATSLVIRDGDVVKGVAHVDPKLARELSDDSPNKASFGQATQRALAATTERARHRERWRIGDPYKNVSWHSITLSAPSLTLPTVAQLQKPLAWVELSIIGLMVVVAANIFRVGAGLPYPVLWAGLLVVAAIACLGIAVWGSRKILSPAKPDAILYDLARTAMASLSDAKLVDPGLSEANIEMSVELDEISVLLVGASPIDTDTFTTALGQVLGPLDNQRYLVRRSDLRLPKLILTPLWLFLRVVLPRPKAPAYFPVPDALGAKKETAMIFAQHWSRFVGGGELIYTRTEEGRRLLLRARAERRANTNNRAFEHWA